MFPSLSLACSFTRLIISSHITSHSTNSAEWPTFIKAQSYAHSIETLAYSATIIYVTSHLRPRHDFLQCYAFLVVSHDAFVEVLLLGFSVMFRFIG